MVYRISFKFCYHVCPCIWLYQAMGIKFHQSLVLTGLIHIKNNKQLLSLPICNDEMIFLLIIYLGMLMKSSPCMNTSFLQTGTITKKDTSVHFLEQQSLLHNHKQVWYRLQEWGCPKSSCECAKKHAEDVQWVSVQFYAFLAESRNEKPDWDHQVTYKRLPSSCMYQPPHNTGY